MRRAVAAAAAAIASPPLLRRLTRSAQRQVQRPRPWMAAGAAALAAAAGAGTGAVASGSSSATGDAMSASRPHTMRLVMGSPAAAPAPAPREATVTVRLTAQEERVFATLLEAAALAPADRGGVTVRVAGGWVRDKLLGRDNNDVDVALDTMSGREFAELVGRVLAASGSRVGTIGVIHANPDQSKHLETATMRVHDMWLDFVNLRSEEYETSSRIPVTRFGTPLEDAQRRDFTVNSMFYNLNAGIIEDLTGMGYTDMQARVLRTPIDPHITFADDPLRLMRAVRFASRFGFVMAPELRAAATDPTIHRGLALKVSRERIGNEMESMLSGARPLSSLRVIQEFGLHAIIFAVPPTGTLAGELTLPIAAPRHAVADIGAAAAGAGHRFSSAGVGMPGPARALHQHPSMMLSREPSAGSTHSLPAFATAHRPAHAPAPAAVDAAIPTTAWSTAAASATPSLRAPAIMQASASVDEGRGTPTAPAASPSAIARGVLRFSSSSGRVPSGLALAHRPSAGGGGAGTPRASPSAVMALIAEEGHRASPVGSGTPRSDVTVDSEADALRRTTSGAATRGGGGAASRGPAPRTKTSARADAAASLGDSAAATAPSSAASRSPPAAAAPAAAAPARHAFTRVDYHLGLQVLLPAAAAGALTDAQDLPPEWACASWCLQEALNYVLEVVPTPHAWRERRWRGTSGLPASTVIGFGAARDMLTPPEAQADALHDHPLPADSRRLLALAVSLLPLANVSFVAGRRSRSDALVAHILSESLKRKAVETSTVRSLVTGSLQLASLMHDDVSKVALGLLLRNVLKENWPLAVWLCAAADCVPALYGIGSTPAPTAAEAESQLVEVLDGYERLVSAVHEWSLDGCWRMKPVLNGEQVMEALGVSRGPELGRILEELYMWQLVHPAGGTAEALTHLAAFVAGGVSVETMLWSQHAAAGGGGGADGEDVTMAAAPVPGSDGGGVGAASEGRARAVSGSGDVIMAGTAHTA